MATTIDVQAWQSNSRDLVEAVIRFERMRELYQQASYEESLGEGTRDPGYSRAWKREYAARDMHAAQKAAFAELDAAGILDLTLSGEDAMPQLIWILEIPWNAPVENRNPHDTDGHMSGRVAGCVLCELGHVGEVWSQADGQWLHPDIRDGNDFGRHEAAQEAAIYLSNPA